MARTWFVKTSAAVLALALLSGCGGARPKAPATPQNTGTPPPAAATKFRVAMVTDIGGLNDESFNAAAWTGLQKTKNDLGIDIKAIESHRQEDYQPNFQQLIDQKFDLIWGIGFLMGPDTERQAKKTPEQKYALIDAAPATPIANIASVLFREEEGSFLMGVMAAKTTKTKKVGFVGGVPSDVIHRFEAGFTAGVKATDPTVSVVPVYANDFNNPNKGKEIALSLYGTGADIIFHAAGNTGNGVLDAAKEQNKFAIGVDKDQNPRAPQNVISSMIKRVDVAVYDVSKMTQAGNFPGGKTTVLGLKEDGVGYAPTTLWDKMPATTKELVDRWAAAIKAGTVTVPNDLDKLKTWQAPTL